MQRREKVCGGSKWRKDDCVCRREGNVWREMKIYGGKGYIYNLNQKKKGDERKKLLEFNDGGIKK